MQRAMGTRLATAHVKDERCFPNPHLADGTCKLTPHEGDSAPNAEVKVPCPRLFRLSNRMGGVKLCSTSTHVHAQVPQPICEALRRAVTANLAAVDHAHQTHPPDQSVYTGSAGLPTVQSHPTPSPLTCYSPSPPHPSPVTAPSPPHPSPVTALLHPLTPSPLTCYSPPPPPHPLTPHLLQSSSTPSPLTPHQVQPSSTSTWPPPSTLLPLPSTRHTSTLRSPSWHPPSRT